MKKKPLGSVGSGLHLLWFRYSGPGDTETKRLQSRSAPVQKVLTIDRYFCTKNSDIEDAVAAFPGEFCKPSASITVRSMLSC